MNIEDFDFEAATKAIFEEEQERIASMNDADYFLYCIEKEKYVETNQLN